MYWVTPRLKLLKHKLCWKGETPFQNPPFPVMSPRDQKYLTHISISLSFTPFSSFSISFKNGNGYSEFFILQAAIFSPSHCISLFNIYFVPFSAWTTKGVTIFLHLSVIVHLLTLNDSSPSNGLLSLQLLLHLCQIILLNKIIIFFCTLHSVVPSGISEGGETRTLPANPLPDYKLLFLLYLFIYFTSFALESTLELLDEGIGVQ